MEQLKKVIGTIAIDPEMVLWGPPGVGKSKMIKEVVKKKKIKVKHLNKKKKKLRNSF